MYRPEKLGLVQLSAKVLRKEILGPASRLAIVGGCGHVGLPLGMSFAKHGIRVDLLDSNVQRVACVNRGEMPFREEGADALLPELIRSGYLRATSEDKILEHASAVIVTIGTPVGDFLDPCIGEFDRSMDDIVCHLRPGQLLILRSTVLPGLTERLGRKLAEVGLDEVHLAFCPERIVQDKSLVELEQLPQIVGGVTPRAAKLAADLFGLICPKIIFVRPIEAELAKLFCNAFRYINFAIANEFYLIAQHHGADFHRIYHAVREDYPRMQGFAHPGFAAGPCLVKDTMQLGAFNHGSFALGQAALEINEGLPYRLVQRLKRSWELKEMTVGILGMAFKANNDDPRDSLAYKLRKVLLLECREVLCTDPYVPDPRLLPLDEVVKRADLLIVATPHDCYSQCEFHQPIVDITGSLSERVATKAGASKSYERPSRMAVNHLAKASA